MFHVKHQGRLVCNAVFRVLPECVDWMGISRRAPPRPAPWGTPCCDLHRFACWESWRLRCWAVLQPPPRVWAVPANQPMATMTAKCVRPSRGPPVCMSVATRLQAPAARSIPGCGTLQPITIDRDTRIWPAAGRIGPTPDPWRGATGATELPAAAGYAVLRAGPLRRCASSNISAAGVMPSIRPAWARVAGRIVSSFWRTSADRPAKAA
jgi:hypothetical protein